MSLPHVEEREVVHILVEAFFDLFNESAIIRRKEDIAASAFVTNKIVRRLQIVVYSVKTSQYGFWAGETMGS